MKHCREQSWDHSSLRPNCWNNNSLKSLQSDDSWVTILGCGDVLNRLPLGGDLAPTLERDDAAADGIKIKYGDHSLHNIVPAVLS